MTHRDSLGGKYQCQHLPYSTDPSTEIVLQATDALISDYGCFVTPFNLGQGYRAQKSLRRFIMERANGNITAYDVRNEDEGLSEHKKFYGWSSHGLMTCLLDFGRVGPLPGLFGHLCREN